MANLCDDCNKKLKSSGKRCRDCHHSIIYKGGVHKTKWGYIRYNMPPRQFLHREAMEKKLGRPLATDEYVHHINGIKDDNRPENLELIDQPSHLRIHKPHLANIRHPVYGYYIKKNKQTSEYAPHHLKRERDKLGKFK